MQKRSLAYSFMILLFCITFFCCRKSSSPTPSSAMRSIAGVWSMHGTDQGSVYNGNYGYNYYDSAVNVTLVMFPVDDSLVVAQTNNDYTVLKLNSSTGSTITLGDVYGGLGMNYVYNFINQSLAYSCNSSSGIGGSEYEQLTSSQPPVVRQNPIMSNTAKMTGLRNWHGSRNTIWIPRNYSLPNVDTTYYDTFAMQINALADTLILNRFYYVGSTTNIWQYLVLRKSFEDRSTTVFTTQELENDTLTLTYYSASNSMFYYDSFTEYLYPDTWKYYTP